MKNNFISTGKINVHGNHVLARISDCKKVQKN